MSTSASPATAGHATAGHALAGHATSQPATRELGSDPAPRLLPGLRVLRRSADVLQVGQDPERHALVRDTPVVRAALRSLREGARVDHDDDQVRTTLVRLHAAGLLVLSRPDAPTGPAAAACQVQHGDRAAARWRARAGTAVAVQVGPGVCESGLGELDRLISRSGLGRCAETTHADVVLLLARDQVERGLTDEHLRAGRPVLVLTQGWAGPVLGPFVVPGATACLRCLDAHRTDRDPRWPVVVEQLAEPDASLVAPCDPGTWQLALSSAARELVTYAEGGRPLTWSSTLTWTESPVPSTQPWSRHPCCGCGWDVVPVEG